jgi:hypothetical protein
VRPVEKVVVATPVHPAPVLARIVPGVPAYSEVVETEVASAVLPVMLARTEFAATCARFVNGRSPVTSEARLTDSHVATPAPLRERTNWLVQVVPAYSPTTPLASVSGSAEVMPEMTRFVDDAVTAVMAVVDAYKNLDAVVDVATT